MRAIDPVAAAAQAAGLRRRRLQRRGGREDRRGDDDRGRQAAAIAFATVRPRGDRDLEARTVNLIFVVEEGAARLHRAHQHPRQHAHARLRDPARVRRRARAMPTTARCRSRRAAPEEPELFQEREDHAPSRARRPTASSSMSTSRSSRPANSRSPAAIRPRTASWPRSASPSAICSGRGLYGKASVQYGQYARGVRAVVRRALFPGLSGGARPRLLLPSSKARPATSPIRRRRWASATRLGFALREDLGLQVRYSLYQQEITLPAQLNNCNNINPDFVNTFPTPDAVALRRQCSISGDRAEVNPIAMLTAKLAGGQDELAGGPVLPRWSATRFPTTLSTTTGTRPAACLPSSSRISPASAAT